MLFLRPTTTKWGHSQTPPVSSSSSHLPILPAMKFTASLNYMMYLWFGHVRCFEVHQGVREILAAIYFPREESHNMHKEVTESWGEFPQKHNFCLLAREGKMDGCYKTLSQYWDAWGICSRMIGRLGSHLMWGKFPNTGLGVAQNFKRLVTIRVFVQMEARFPLHGAGGEV